MPIEANIYYFAHGGEGEEGEEDTIVLVHGAGGTHLYWPAEIRRLPEYRVLAVDLPGHGKSGGHGIQSISAYQQSLLDWMDAIYLRKAAFVGHSLGSAVVLALALENPERTSALGLIGAGARLRVNPEIFTYMENEATFQKGIDAIVQASFSPHTPPELVALAASRMAETRPGVLRGDFQACNLFDVIETVSEIRQPTLIVCGAEDRMTPVRYSQYLSAQIPNNRLEIIPEAGHMVMLEKPQLVAGILKEFFDEVL